MVGGKATLLKYLRKMAIGADPAPEVIKGKRRTPNPKESRGQSRERPDGKRKKFKKISKKKKGTDGGPEKGNDKHQKKT